MLVMRSTTAIPRIPAAQGAVGGGAAPAPAAQQRSLSLGPQESRATPPLELLLEVQPHCGLYTNTHAYTHTYTHTHTHTECMRA